jgi:hypothetical protein
VGLDATHLDTNDIILTRGQCGVICWLVHQRDPAGQPSDDLPLELFLPVVERNVRGSDDHGVAVAVAVAGGVVVVVHRCWRRRRRRGRMMVPPERIGIEVEHEQVEGRARGVVRRDSTDEGERGGYIGGRFEPRGERGESVAMHRATPLLKAGRDEPATRLGSPVGPLDVQRSLPLPHPHPFLLRRALLPKEACECLTEEEHEVAHGHTTVDFKRADRKRDDAVVRLRGDGGARERGRRARVRLWPGQLAVVEDHRMAVRRARGDVREHQVLRLRLRLRLRTRSAAAARGARRECYSVSFWHHQQRRACIEKGVRADAGFVLAAIHIV